MNPQYLQQQTPFYGSQTPNSPYGEPNANVLPKDPQESQPFLPQKSPLSSPPLNNGPPAPTNAYEKEIQHGSQANQNNLVDQMANVSLSGIQKNLTVNIVIYK